MKIVIISHFFYPEIGAPSARLYEMSKVWADLGHEIHIVTCFPNHPTGVVPDKYKGKLYSFEVLNGLYIHRNYVYATPNKGFIKKTIGHISFMISSVVFSLSKIQEPDIILTSSPTFFSMFSGYIYSLLKKADFVLEIRDLWPAAMIDLGVMKKNIITDILEMLELYMYKKCKKLVMVTHSFKENVVRRGIPEDKVYVITNGVNEQIFYPRPKNNALIDKFGIYGKFIISYIGAHGLSQNLKTILYVAKELSFLNDIVFVFVGEGAEKDDLKIIAKKENIGNIMFLDSYPKEMMPDIYCISDISLIPLKNVEIFQTFIPSKIFELLACGIPIVASVNGESANLLKQSKASIVVEPDNVKQISLAIRHLYNNRVELVNMAKNGPYFVRKNYSRFKLANDYLQILDID